MIDSYVSSIYVAFSSVFYAVEWIILDDELGSMHNAIPYFNIYFRICLEKLRNTM
jgi:hypothetical protein